MPGVSSDSANSGSRLRSHGSSRLRGRLLRGRLVSGRLLRGRLGAVHWLILCGAALVIAIASGTGYLALEFRERALEVAQRELTNSALLLSRHFDQQLADL